MNLLIDSWWYKLLNEQGSLIASLVALIAGILAYWAGIIQAKATRRAAETHVKATERTKRLEARGVAVAVDLGFQTLETDIKRARNNLERLKTDASTKDVAGQTIMAGAATIAKIASPPILERNVDRLFMLGDEAGPLCLSLIHMLYEHDVRVDASTNRMGSNEPRPVANGGR
jgi:hypothetical protein